MKKLLLLFIMASAFTCMAAQEHGGKPQKFSPEKFDADLQAFIIREAGLTTQEAARFFPVYKEMQQKQRTLYDKQRELSRQKPQDEEKCLKAIEERDETDLEMKRIQKAYHKRFLDMLPASKVYDIIKAEDRFHRRMLRGFSHDGHDGGQKQRPQK